MEKIFGKYIKKLYLEKVANNKNLQKLSKFNEIFVSQSQDMKPCCIEISSHFINVCGICGIFCKNFLIFRQSDKTSEIFTKITTGPTKIDKMTRNFYTARFHILALTDKNFIEF